MLPFMQFEMVLFKALLLLLIIQYPNHAFGESRCMYDEIMRLNGAKEVVVVPELPQKSKSSIHTYTAITAEDETWNPIRIVVSSKDLEDNSKYCSKDSVNGQKPRPDFLGGTAFCHSKTYFTEDKKKLLLEKLLPASIKLHSDRLMVKPVKGNLIVPQLGNTSCKHFTVPNDHHTTGVENADLVLYLAAPPTHTWAVTCATLESDKGRPIVAAMSFFPGGDALTHYEVRTGAHELAHALGFNYKNMLKHGLIENITDIRGKKHKVSVVKGDKTKEAVQKHFNCSSATGMELEDEGHSFLPGAHWERRNAKDELMSAYVGIGLYTALTMSFFEDLKYYKAKWGMEEPMPWASNAGCDFLVKKCIENGRNPFPEMFCTESKCNQVSCTSDRMAVARCQLEEPSKPLESNYQYFANKKHAGWKYALTDYCPIVSNNLMYCTNKKIERQLNKIGSRVGSHSHCLKGDSLIIDGETVGDVCAEVQCNANKTVHIRYLGDDNYHECTEGETITPTATFVSGKIKCPIYKEVCTVGSHGESLIKQVNEEK